MGLVPYLHIRYIYGTGPMHVSQVCMGPVPWEPVFNLQTLETFHDTFQSHTRYWEAYGTSPIPFFHTCMGPVPCFAT